MIPILAFQGATSQSPWLMFVPYLFIAVIFYFLLIAPMRKRQKALSAMVDSLKLNRLMTGYRGRPAADRPALDAAALALGRFFLDHRDRIADIEINPLMVRSSGAVAVDVRVLWRDASGSAA